MYVCEFCGREFRSAGGINGHRNAHLIRNGFGHRIGLPCEVCEETTYYQMQGIPYHPDCFAQRWSDDEEYEAEWKRPRKAKKKSGVKLLPSSLSTGLSEMTQMISGKTVKKNADTARWHGACILPDGSCRQMDFATCNTFGGKFQSPQTTCDNTQKWIDADLAQDYMEDRWYQKYQAEDRPEEERMTRATADNLVAQILEWLEPFTDFAEVCGSYRRGREDPGDLDVVVILKSRVSLPEITELWVAEGKASAVNWVGDKKTQMVIEGVKVDIRTSTPRALGAALLYFTGPSGYNIGIRSAAKRAGFKLNEYGLFNRETGEYIAGATEEDIYTALGRNYRPPTERRAETFEASAVYRGKQPQTAVEKAVITQKLMDEAEMLEAIQKLENAVRLGLISEEEIMRNLQQKFGAECDACSGTFSAEGTNGNQVFNSCWKCGSGLHLYQIFRYPATPDEIAGVGGDPNQADDSYKIPREDWNKDWEREVAREMYCSGCNKIHDECSCYGAESFDAEVVMSRYSGAGWSLFGRKLYKYGKLQGSIRGNISATTEKPMKRNNPEGTYSGRYHVIWIHNPDNQVFNQVSQKIKPESFEQWMDVIHETNRQLNHIHEGSKQWHGKSENWDVFEHHGLADEHDSDEICPQCSAKLRVEMRGDKAYFYCFGCDYENFATEGSENPMRSAIIRGLRTAARDGYVVAAPPYGNRSASFYNNLAEIILGELGEIGTEDLGPEVSGTGRAIDPYRVVADLASGRSVEIESPDEVSDYSVGIADMITSFTQQSTIMDRNDGFIPPEGYTRMKFDLPNGLLTRRLGWKISSSMGIHSSASSETITLFSTPQKNRNCIMIINMLLEELQPEVSSMTDGEKEQYYQEFGNEIRRQVGYSGGPLEEEKRANQEWAEKTYGKVSSTDPVKVSASIREKARADAARLNPFRAETQDFADRFEIQIRTSRGNTTERIPVGRPMLVRRLREILSRQRLPYAIDVFGTEAAFNVMGPFGMQVYRPRPKLLATYKYGRFESGEMADHLNEKLGL